MLLARHFPVNTACFGDEKRVASVLPTQSTVLQDSPFFSLFTQGAF
jgi:hypothetical protein